MKCEDCDFYKKNDFSAAIDICKKYNHPIPPELLANIHRCYRYPETITVFPGHWCGEFRTTPMSKRL